MYTAKYVIILMKKRIKIYACAIYIHISILKSGRYFERRRFYKKIMPKEIENRVKLFLLQFTQLPISMY